MKWTSYAEMYDFMSGHNSEYRKILREFSLFLDTYRNQNPKRILDLGAGTGNFSIPAALRFPEAEVWHLEPDPEAMALAKEKSKAMGITNIRFVQKRAEDFSPQKKFDFLICVHSLFSIPRPQETLQLLVTKGLNEGAPVFLCDIGRKLNLDKWHEFMVSQLLHQFGVAKTQQIFRDSLAVHQRQKEIHRLQQEGVYWLHSHQEFQQAVKKMGLEIREAKIVYLGDSDLILARYQKAS